MSAIGRWRPTVTAETAAGALLAATVCCFVLGSSSVPRLVQIGTKLRWGALFVLAAYALVLAARSRRSLPPRAALVVFALAGWLTVVALVSALWSVDPRLTFGRTVSFGVLLVAAAALAVASTDRPELPRRLAEGVLVAAALVAAGGFLLLAHSRAYAIEPAPGGVPTRFRGLGENPDTVAMLEGLAAPLALWALLRARNRAGRLLAACAYLLFLAAFAASGSRGGLLAALAGGLVFALLLPGALRRRLVVAAAVVVTVAVATVGSRVTVWQTPTPTQTVVVTTPSGKKVTEVVPVPNGTPIRTAEERYGGLLGDELDRTFGGNRPFWSTSGRVQAWAEAIHQADARPIAGYGFGTEENVFFERVLNFAGRHVENSFVGMYLQLGAVGFLSFVALLLAAAVAVFRAARQTAGDGAALAGVLAAGIALMFVQSYAYAVGNVATVAFWTMAFVAAARVPASRIAAAPVGEEGEAGGAP